MLLVDANKPWKTLAEFTEHLKGRGSNGSYATATQMGMVMSELYKSHLGLQTVPVNYKAVADSVNDLLSGQLDMIAGDPAFALGLVKGGKARALATTGATRSGAFPTVPTMTESGVPMDLVSYWGMIAPAGTPDAIIERLNGWFVQILKTEEARKFFNDVAPSDILFTTKEQAREILERDAKLWAEYVKVAKIEPN